MGTEDLSLTDYRLPECFTISRLLLRASPSCYANLLLSLSVQLMSMSETRLSLERL